MPSASDTGAATLPKTAARVFRDAAPPPPRTQADGEVLEIKQARLVGLCFACALHSMARSIAAVGALLRAACQPRQEGNDL